MAPSLASLPPWVRYAAGGLALLLAPLGVLLVMPPSPSEVPSATEVAEPTSEEAERIDRALRVIRTGTMNEVRALVGGPLSVEYPAVAYRRFLEALEARRTTLDTRDGVLAYGQLIRGVIERRLPSPDLPRHLVQLRRRCLEVGGLPLLADAADPIFGDRYLEDYYPDARLQALEHALLFERWDRALAIYQLMRTAPQSDGAERRDLARRMARIQGASGTPAASSEFQRLLENVAADLAEPAEHAESARAWLQGIATFHSPGPGFDRGAALLEAGLVLNPSDPGFSVTHLDFAQALAAEAARREATLRSEFAAPEGDPARHVFLIGAGAARLGDREEVAFVVQRLRERAGVSTAESSTYETLLTGAGQILDGQSEAGRSSVARWLADPSQVAGLRAAELAHWQEIGRTGTIPEADVGATLFECGTLWWKLREWGRMRRTTERLERSLATAEDLSRLNYLKAILGYRDNEVAGTRELLLGILDAGPPPDLSRGEVASLLYLTEEREKELGRIATLRRQARGALERVLRSSPEDSPETVWARADEWKLDLEERGADFLAEGGSTRLSELLARLDVPAPPLDSIERRLSLQALVISLAQLLHGEGQLDAALTCLRECEGLVWSPARFYPLLAEVLESRAAATPPSDEERLPRWRSAGEAYVKAAKGDYGSQRFLFDAARCYLEGRALELAWDSLREYSPLDRDSGDGEARYWQRPLLLARIQRQRGNPDEAIEILDAVVDEPDAGPLRFDMLLERGLSRVARGSESDLRAAAGDFEAVYSGMLPTSSIWHEAVYQQATLLHRRHLGLDPADPEADPVRDASLRAWEDLAARLSAQGGSDRLPEALFRAAEGRALRQQPALARGHFERLAEAARHVLESPGVPVSPEARARWSDFAEKGAFGMADNEYSDGRRAQARAFYERALKRYPEAPLTVWGHFRLGELAAERGEIAAARAEFQLAQAKLARLGDPQLGELPPRRDRAWWQRMLAERAALQRP
ncbi:MAG: tetratricopeptide repeat protein [Planctomycetota bacterium]